eukprot:2513865-Pleurochrysis_carterae.AAC.2
MTVEGIWVALRSKDAARVVELVKSGVNVNALGPVRAHNIHSRLLLHGFCRHRGRLFRCPIMHAAIMRCAGFPYVVSGDVGQPSSISEMQVSSSYKLRRFLRLVCFSTSMCWLQNMRTSALDLLISLRLC